MAPARPTELTDSPARPASPLLRLLIVLTVVGVLVGVAGLLVPKIVDPQDDSTAKQRQAVVQRASDFAVAYNTYDVADLASYQKRMKTLLTTKYDTQFNTITSALFPQLKTTKQKSGGAKVLAVAVDSLDKDSAVALVAVDSAITNTSNKAAVARHFRWKVSFVKTKGQWLVNDFESVAALGAESATSTPSASPTTPTPTSGSTSK